MKRSYCVIFFLFLTIAARAQAPTDLQFVPKGNVCAGMSYGYSRWDQYWEGDTLRINGNVGHVVRHQVAAGMNVGLLDWLNLIVMVPYVSTSPTQGTLRGQSGFSDLSVFVKGKYAELSLGTSRLLIGGTLGFLTPISDYLVDFAPLNIGNGTQNLSYRQLVKFQLTSGIYTNATANYTRRSNIASIHRGGFYYDGNEAYYSDEVRVPDAYDLSVALGYQSTRVLAEAGFTHYQTLGGTDMRTWDVGFPANNVDASTVYLRLDYYFKTPKGLNLSLVGGNTIAGRNHGKPFYFSLAMNFLFGLWQPAAKVH